MASLVVYADIGDTTIESSNSTYATARSGSGLFVHTVTDEMVQVGQAFFSPDYYCLEAPLPFDTSALGSSATITAAVLDLYGHTDNDSQAGGFNVLAGIVNYTTPIVAATEWQDGTELAALTPVATFASGGFSNSGYNTFGDTGPGLASVINKTGITKLFLWSDRQEADTTPTVSEYLQFWSGDQTTSPERRPRLTITYTTVALTTARPDADVTTTGWSTAPLWSKIEESSADGTVISATAS